MAKAMRAQPDGDAVVNQAPETVASFAGEQVPACRSWSLPSTSTSLTVRGTSGHVADDSKADSLLHGEEIDVFAEPGYLMPRKKACTGT